jgi:hypothetical protein
MISVPDLRGGPTGLLPGAPKCYVMLIACNKAIILKIRKGFTIFIKTKLVSSRPHYCYGVVSNKAFHALLPFSDPLCVLICSKILRHGGPMVLLLLQRKSCSGFLSPLKIHRLRPGLNSRTLGPMASTITTRPPRTNLLH